jgi:uncharacterized membrane protein
VNLPDQAARLVPVGRALFALALIGLGLDHLLLGDFVTGRAPPWPASLPGGRPFAYVTGLLIVGAGVAMLTGRHARVAAITTAALILIYALPRHVPVLLDSAVLSSAWTRVGKALWLAGGSLAVAATFPAIRNDADPTSGKVRNLDRGFVAAGRVSVGLFQVLAGIQHFKFATFAASLIPPWFPGDPMFWTYFAGVALIAGGIGLLVPRTAGWAALLSGWMIFSWVFLVHLPLELAGTGDRIAIFEAPAAAGILFLIAGLHARAAYFNLTR